ncbi:hypothetical protein QTP88_016079 [Uroleucon formosanum]
MDLHDSVSIFKSSLNYNVKALTTISDWNEQDSSSKAKTLFTALCSCEFIISLHSLSLLLCVSASDIKLLQSANGISQAADVITDILSNLENKIKNCNGEFKALFRDAEIQMTELDIELKKPRIASKQISRSNYQITSIENYYKYSIYIPLLDNIITDLKSRILNEKYHGISTLPLFLPLFIIKSDTNNTDILLKIIKQYFTFEDGNIIDALKLNIEFKLWKSSCFAHSLNLTVQTALKSITETREKVRGIVGHFKRSPQAAEKLKTMQEQLGLTPTLVLIQDVITRWNSTYEMFERIYNLKVPLSSVLVECNYNVYLTNEDWQIISKSCEILKHFKEITIEISSEKSVSISKSIVFSRALLKHCAHLDTQLHDSPQQLKNMISNLKQQVEQRFGSLEKLPIYAEATILDPRFKKFGFFMNSSFSEGKKTLISKATAIHTGNKKNTQPAIQIQTSIIAKDSIWKDFDEEVSSQLRSTNSTSAAIVEIDKYLQEPLIPRHESPLKWWKDNQNVYPCLFELMKKRLCILATSVPCERIFSKAGQTISEKRSRLSSKNFEKMIFVNFNSK